MEAQARDEWKARSKDEPLLRYSDVLAAKCARDRTATRLYAELESAHDEIDDLKAMLHEQKATATRSEAVRGWNERNGRAMGHEASMRDAKENATEMRELRLAPTMIGERSQGPLVLRSGLESDDDWRSVSSVRSGRLERKA
jgi:hypothetical protein